MSFYILIFFSFYRQRNFIFLAATRQGFFYSAPDLHVRAPLNPTAAGLPAACRGREATPEDEPRPSSESRKGREREQEVWQQGSSRRVSTAAVGGWGGGGSDETCTHTHTYAQIRRGTHTYHPRVSVRADIYIYTDIDLQFAINMGWTDQKLHIYKRHIKKRKTKR